MKSCSFRYLYVFVIAALLVAALGISGVNPALAKQSSHTELRQRTFPLPNNNVSAPDLVITKTNNVSGSVQLPNPWTWTIRITNYGNADAVFSAAGSYILNDNLPSSGVSYSGLSAPNFGGGASFIGSITSSLSSSNLSLRLNSGTLTLPPGGWLETSLTATPSAPGTYTNPRPGGFCTADTSAVITEINERNNTCSDTVTVIGPAVNLSATSIDFGSQGFGTTSAAQTVTVKNTGNADLHIGALTFTSDWIISSDTCSSATVLPSGTCTFDVAFAPLALGPLTGSVGIPSNAITSPDSVTLSGNGVTLLSSSFTSLGAYDGSVTEKTESANIGGGVNTNGTFFTVGDTFLDQQVMGFLHFDTSSLPDNAVVTGVTLRVKQYQVVGSNPFATFGPLYVDIAKPYFGSGQTLLPTDFEAAASASPAGSFNPALLAGNWYQGALGSSAFAFVNSSGSTQFRLRFELDDNDNNNNLIRFFSGNAFVAGYRPVLTVEYYIPIPTCAPVPSVNSPVTESTCSSVPSEP